MFYSLPEHSRGFPSLSRTLSSNQFFALHHLLDGWTEAGQMFPGEPGALCGPSVGSRPAREAPEPDRSTKSSQATAQPLTPTRGA